VIVWRDVFLGVIAVATLAIAVAQIAVIVAAASAAKRLGELADTFEREVKPLVGHLNAIGRDAARAAQLATAQVERADKLFADVAQRFEQTLAGVEASISAPAREGRALLSAFRAAFQALRELRRDGRGRQGRGDDEDALFI
jgi:archaellum biogenesis protein FlaJ (TadC family)